MLVQQDIPVADEIDRLAPKKPIRSRPAKSRGARETGKGGVHRAVVALVRRAYPQAEVIHLENETFGRLAPAQVAAKIADGMRRGAPDLITAWPGERVVWLEVKREKGGVISDAQRDCHARLRRMGFHVAVVRSIDDAVAAFRAAGVIA
ncbi:VRR-NUC domain-containing protein [Roseomonas mucosa]|uniref:VRR-NUC domain-containing protein n=1 Tax=Roseomonas mucosa TaxID=207340 RepID=UPI00384FC4D5